MQLTSRQYRNALLFLALLGLIFVLITTSKYGAGVSSDAVRAMSTAEGLLSGKGFVDFVGAPYVLWPPLYPLLLAGVSLLTRLDVFHVAWYLNVALFPLNTWLWGTLFQRAFPSRLPYALVASAAAVFSSSMIRIYANVASDPLFVTLMVLFFLVAADHLEGASGRALWMMLCLAGLSMVQRYLGVVLFGVAGLVVLYRNGWRGIPRLVLPAAAATIPLGAWLLLHNYLQFHTLFGGRAYDEMWPLENISLSLTKMLHWFLPYAPGLKSLLLRPWAILLPLAALLGLLNMRHKEQWAAWTGALKGRFAWPALLFSVVYYFLLAFTVNTIDHRDLTSDRYYIILLPVLLMFLLLTWEHLVAPHLSSSRAAQAGALAVLVLWFLYPLYDLQEYLRLSLVNGEPSNYNIYNSSHFTELQLVKEGRRLAQAYPEATIYSNYVNLLWFQYKRPIHMLLPGNSDLPQQERVASLRQKYPGWPGDEPGYIIWFTPNEYKYLAPPQDLSALAKLKLIYRDDNGEIYQVSGGE
jgi:hypothetical protein